MRTMRWKLLVCFLLNSGCGDDGNLLPSYTLVQTPSPDQTIPVSDFPAASNTGGEGEEPGSMGDPTDLSSPRETPPPIHMYVDDVPVEEPGGASEAPESEEEELPTDGDETPGEAVEEPEEVIESGDDDFIEEEEEDEESDEATSSGPSCAGGVHHYVVTTVNPDGSVTTTVVICGDIEDTEEPDDAVEEPPADDDETPEDPVEEPEEVEEVIESEDDVIPGDDDVPTGDDDSVEEVEEDDTEEEPVGDDDVADPQLPVDQDGDGFVEGEDCDDLAAAINPGAVEVCDDGIDNNCNGWADSEAEVDGCVVSEEPIVDPPADDPPTEDPEEDEGEPSVTVAPSNTTPSSEESPVVAAGSEGVVLGKFGLECTADGCLVKSITLQVEVDNMSYDVHEVVGRCRLNQVEPEESGIGGPQPLDRHAKYVSYANFWLETESVPQFVLLCDMAASVPDVAVQLTAFLLLAETEVWDQDFHVLPLSCAEYEGNPVIGVVNITPL